MLKSNMTFIDLFAGMGGFHYVLSKYGLKCVFASEIDPIARQTYEANFDIDFPFNENITKINPKSIPKHDILCAGFPCQPFSGAGLRKGTRDERHLFPYILDIVKAKKPKILILENVRGLLTIEKGKAFENIKKSIEDLGYSFNYKVLKACEYGVPQLRPRLFMVCFRDGRDFEFPKPIKLKKTLHDIVGGQCSRDISKTVLCRMRGKEYGNRDSWEVIYKTGGISRTVLSSGTGTMFGKSMWSDIYKNGVKHRLTVDEIRQVMGYPKYFKIVGGKSQSIKQFGNSIVPQVVRAIVKEIIRATSDT